MKCKDCKYWEEDEKQKARKVTHDDNEGFIFSKEYYRMGFCHRFPRYTDRDLGFEFYWCGEFKKKENKNG